MADRTCLPRSGLVRMFVLFIVIVGVLLLYGIYSQRLGRRLGVHSPQQHSMKSSADAWLGISKSSTISSKAEILGSASHSANKPPAAANKAPKKYVKPREPPRSSEEISKATRMMETLQLFRDLYAQEAWPEISREGGMTPDQVSYTVHYIWCGKNREFQFQHYLGLLSVIRLLQPLTIVFHYSDLPVPDRLWYHVWFWELKQSLASLELKPLAANHKSCDAKQLTATALDLLSHDGGLYIAPNVILTRFPKDITRQSFWYSMAGGSLGILFSLRGFNGETRQEYTKRVQAKERDCASVDNYNKLGAGSSPPCLLLTNKVYPKDIVATKTPFAELARWLHYGKRKVLEAQQSSTSSIPRIAHVTWLRNPKAGNPPFYFFHFLSILSALHVAGLRHVYVYGDAKPQGQWWDRLKKENVTFVPIQAISHVFQQSVNIPAHRSDVIRPHLLRAYGGVYMDVDVFWVSPLPDSLLRYPTVACPDWPSRGEWPAAFNIGVLMSQSDSPWLSHFLATMRRYIDEIWFYNAIMMPYRVYEMYPESLHIDHYLQVICFRGNCHPTWHDDYIRDINDPRPPRDFDWREGRSYHFTVPKPHKSLTSPDEIRKRQDIYAEMGYQILTKSGWGSLIGES